jgi:hypothetical protein
MHGPISVKSPNNISKWQIGFNSAFKGLIFFEGAIFGGKKLANFNLRLMQDGNCQSKAELRDVIREIYIRTAIPRLIKM